MNMYHDPLLTLNSILRSWFDFFSLKNESVFGFASGGELIFRNIVDSRKSNDYIIWRVLLYILCVTGLHKCWKNRHIPRYRLILFCLLGTFLSIPFLPPKDSGLMRVYAGTITSILILPSIGFSYLFPATRKVEALIFTELRRRDFSTNILVGSGIFLFMATFFVPIFIKHDENLPDLINPKCTDGLKLATVRVIPGSVVNIVADWQSTTIIPLSITKMTFINSIEDFPMKEYVLPLEKLIPPVAIANVFDIRTHAYFWMIIHKNLIVNTPQILSACGIWNKAMLARGLNFFETKDIYVLSY
jgi:hypothetical protein